MERVLPQGRLLPAQEPDIHESSDHSKEEVEESPPEKSDIEKLQESVQEMEVKEAHLKKSLERAGDEIQQYKAELDTVKTELQYLKVKFAEKSKDLQNVRTAVDKHKSELGRTPRLIRQASRDLVQKFQKDTSDCLLFQESTKKDFAQVQLRIKSVKSEVESKLTRTLETQLQAKIPELQHDMKEELDKNMQQLRDEVKREMSDMRCEVMKQLMSATNEQSRRIDKCTDELSTLRHKLEEYDRRQQKWEIVRELQEKSGGGKGAKP